MASPPTDPGLLSPPPGVPLHTALGRLSVVTPHGGEHASDCGYCGGEGGRYSYGASTRRLTCADYQALCEAGWRRSGEYVYKPANARTCCPNLTIRLDVARFQATKEQHRLLRRLNEFLAGGPHTSGNGGDDDAASAVASESGGGGRQLHQPSPAAAALAALLRQAAAAAFPHLPSDALAGVAVTPLKPAQAAVAPPAGGGGAAPTHTSNAAFVVAAACRRAAGVVPQRPKKGDAAAAAAAATAASEALSPAAVPPPPQLASPLQVAVALVERVTALVAAGGGGADLPPSTALAVAGPGNINAVLPPAVEDEGVHEPPQPHQPRQHDAGHPPSHKRTKHDGGGGSGGASAAAATTAAPAPAVAAPAHTWRVVTVPAAFDEEAWRLYVRYQTAVHGDSPQECSRGQYERFLCRSPLVREPFGAPVGQHVLSAPAPTSRGKGGAKAAPGTGDDDAVAWQSPAGAAVRRCADALSRAWRDGEGCGAGLPLTADPVPPPMNVDGAGAPPHLPPSYSGFKPGAHHVCPDMPGGAQWQGAGVDAAAAAAAPAGGATPLSASASASAGLAPSAGGAADLRAHGYGAFHHRYYLDGVLVAVGVVDVLPACLSSVYVFYDPELSGTKAVAPASSSSAANAASTARWGGVRLELGKLTALREIQWVADAAARASPRLRYYFMGYYVHSCPKMRYKAGYAPSDLRCPATGRWVPLADAARLLDADRYARLAPAPATDAERAAEADAARLELARLAALLPGVPLVVGPAVSVDALATLRQLNEYGRALVARELRALLERTGTELGGRLVAQFQ
jgi:arginyl-tRNA--protein-N-Asp/Glu arginylyltransferase